MEIILRGNLPFYEPGLEELVKETLKSGFLTFTSRSEDLGEAIWSLFAWEHLLCPQGGRYLPGIRRWKRWPETGKSMAWP